jgi:hypothetical protein
LASDTAAWRWTALVVISIYLLTAHWQSGQVNDAQAAIWPAWQFAHTGSLDLSDAAGLPDLPWFHAVSGRTVSDRTMGVILAGIPFAVLTAPLGLEPMQVGALTAAVLTGLAVANMHLVFRAVAHSRLAAWATVALAFGSPLWTTAAAELWTHGPDAFWLSLALLAVSRQRYALAGLSFAPAIMTRPHLCVAAAGMGAVLAWRGRSVKPLGLIGLPAAAGLVAVYLWNAWYFQAAGIGGGTYGSRLDAVTSAPNESALLQFAQDVGGAFLSPAVGLLVYAPVSALLLWLTPGALRSAPPWAVGSLVGGVLYEAIQLRLNRYTGGGGFYSNRLITEFVVLSAPVWLVGAAAFLSRQGRARLDVLPVLSALGVSIHAFGAVNAYYWRGGVAHWYAWYPQVVLQARGFAGYLIACGLSLIPLVALLLVRQQRITTRADVPEQRASPSGGPRVPT